MEKKIVLFSIDRVRMYVAVMLREKINGSVRRYKPLKSSTNCGCGHLMMQSVGIACNSS